ncbi:hypothetical protein Ae331Ps2_5029c [Pseudonocardia sp. Ae331_Ps2]|nr:hypothetical protein Ae331Ps2_5029c [Pseudonocardia sp. Ae331_Ps2]
MHRTFTGGGRPRTDRRGEHRERSRRSSAGH